MSNGVSSTVLTTAQYSVYQALLVVNLAKRHCNLPATDGSVSSKQRAITSHLQWFDTILKPIHIGLIRSYGTAKQEAPTTLARVLAMALCLSVCVCLSVTSRYSIETDGWIDLFLARRLLTTYPHAQTGEQTENIIHQTPAIGWAEAKTLIIPLKLYH